MAHEDLTREEVIEGSTDRVFGVVFAVVFLLIASWPLFYGGQPRWWACFVSAALALVALAKPALLRGPNRLWMKFGILLGHIVSPIALGLLFYAVFTPMGLVMRLVGKDPLRLRLDREADTYWMPRRTAGAASDFDDQPVLGTHHVDAEGALAFHARPQEVLAAADLRHDGAARLLIVLAQGSAVAPFIYTLF